jgi:hypothetical protein
MTSPLFGTFTQMDRAESFGLAQLDLSVLGQLQPRHEGRGDRRAAPGGIGEAGRKEGFERLPVDGDAKHLAQTLRRLLDREELHRRDLVGVGVLGLHLMAVGREQVVELHVPHRAAHDDDTFRLPAGKDVPAELERTDFLPFKLLSDLPWAMTGHLLFEAIDPTQAITVSAGGVKDVIRGHIGFDGLLLSDDLSMQALGGSLGERAARSLAAGCDIALHCNGKMPEMQEVVANTGPMTALAGRRFEAGRKALARAHAPLGKAGLADAEKQVASLLPAWG